MAPELPPTSGLLRRFAEKFFGRPTTFRANPLTATVQTTATRILDFNPDRVLALIINNSVNRGFVNIRPDVSTTVGIPLEANGGQLMLLAEEDGELVGSEWFALLQTASGSFYVLEVFAR